MTVPTRVNRALVPLRLGHAGADPHAFEVFDDGVVEQTHLGAELYQHGGPTLTGKLVAVDPLQLSRRSAALAPRGELVIVGVSSVPVPIGLGQLIVPALSVTGHSSGTAREVEETMHFSVLSGVRA